MLNIKKNKKTIVFLFVSIVIILITIFITAAHRPVQKGSGLKEMVGGVKAAVITLANNVGMAASETSGIDDFEAKLSTAADSGQSFMIKPNGSIVMFGDKNSKKCQDELAFIYLMQKNQKILNTTKSGTLKYYEEYFKDPAHEEIVKSQNCTGYVYSEFYGVFKLQDSENYQFIYFVGNDEEKLKEEIAGSRQYAGTLNDINNLFKSLGEMLTPEELK